MDWRQAKASTLQAWFSIRDSIGQAEPVDLLTEVNAVCDLCEKAKQTAAGDLAICRYCLATRQFGGCRGICAELSEPILDQDWDQVRRLVDQFIDHLDRLEVPPDSDAGEPS